MSVNGYQLAWTLYILGALGCAVAAWLLFRRFGREWKHFFVITVLVLLLTPYAFKAEEMVMAPAIFILVMDGLADGFDSVKPITILLLGLWLLALVISLLFQLATRPKVKVARPSEPFKPPMDNLDDEEIQARDELLEGEFPLRAER